MLADLLQPLCSRDLNRSDWTRAPWSLVYEGNRYVGATNGHALIAIRSDEEVAGRFGSDLAPIMPRMPSRAVDLAALKEWAGRGIPRIGDICPECKGERYRVCAEGCRTLNQINERVEHPEHFVKCRWCAATGKLVERRTGPAAVTEREGVILGRGVDRALLFDFLAPLAGTTCAISGDQMVTDPLLVKADNGFALVMPVRTEVDKIEDRFEIPTRVVGGSFCPACAKGDHSQHQKQLGGICVGCACTTTSEAA